MSNDYILKLHIEAKDTVYTNPETGQSDASAYGHVWYEIIAPNGTVELQAGFAPEFRTRVPGTVYGTTLLQT